MTGCTDDAERTDEVTPGGHYRTGDIGSRDADGHITHPGRTDDVFEASDRRNSPCELESVLLEREAVAEAAVVSAPDALRLSVCTRGLRGARRRSRARRAHGGVHPAVRRENLARYESAAALEFSELPETSCGTIRRVELRGRESDLRDAGERAWGEHREEGFPGLEG